MIDFIKNNWIEIIGTTTGFAYIYFEIKANPIVWIMGFITSVFYIFIFYNAKIYADMSLQFYYVAISFYGWILWTKKSESSKPKYPVCNISLNQIYILSGTFVGLLIIIYLVLLKFTDSPIPFVDALTTALSIVATWMLARKIIQHWYLWIFINAASVAIYVYRELYFTVALFIAYFLLSIIGLIQWKKEISNNEPEKQ